MESQDVIMIRNEFYVTDWRTCLYIKHLLIIRAGTNTPSDEYDTYRDTGWRIRYVSRIHFFSEAKLSNG